MPNWKRNPDANCGNCPCSESTKAGVSQVRCVLEPEAIWKTRTDACSYHPDFKLETAIELRDISDEKAKQEITEAFKAILPVDGPLFYSTLSERLRLDIRQVVRVCDGLMEEGLIQVDESADRGGY